MNVKPRYSGDVTVLELNGRFDKNTAPTVRQWLEKVSSAAPANVVVNLGQVSFVDSTALAVLVQGVKRCRQKSGDLHLCGIQQPVYMIFELTRLDKAFSIFADEQHAIQAFDSEQQPV